ncbi:MAG TPA: hypothetical protein VHF69_07605 [Candidatus Synoicihabitans sp.]|nr:hypothetical protein [Candidatus Synoicihabitans sp.]
MTAARDAESLRRLASPAELGLPLQALWHDAQGDWEMAHTVAQRAGDRDGDWVHAYLHRKEGDEANARYWYTRAGRPLPAVSLDDEWAAIVTDLLRR